MRGNRILSLSVLFLSFSIHSISAGPVRGFGDGGPSTSVSTEGCDPLALCNSGGGGNPNYNTVIPLSAGPVSYNLQGNPIISDGVSKTCQDNAIYPVLLTLSIPSNGYNLVKEVRAYGWLQREWTPVYGASFVLNGPSAQLSMIFGSKPGYSVAYVCGELGSSQNANAPSYFFCGVYSCNSYGQGVQVANGADWRVVPGGYIPNGEPGSLSGASGPGFGGLGNPTYGNEAEAGGICGAIRLTNLRGFITLSVLVISILGLWWSARRRFFRT